MGWSPAQVGALENCGIKVEDATGDIQWREFETIDIIKPDPIKSPKSNIQYEATRLPDYNKVGNIIAVTVAWRGGTYMIKMFFPTVKETIEKGSSGSSEKSVSWIKLVTYQVSEYDSGEPIIQTR